MQDLDRRDRIACMILQGFCANPAIFASNPRSGWSLVNCNDAELCGYAISLATTMCEGLEHEAKLAEDRAHEQEQP